VASGLPSFAVRRVDCGDVVVARWQPHDPELAALVALGAADRHPDPETVFKLRAERLGLGERERLPALCADTAGDGTARDECDVDAAPYFRGLQLDRETVPERVTLPILASHIAKGGGMQGVSGGRSPTSTNSPVSPVMTTRWSRLASSRSTTTPPIMG
jgi:hypothetical protein